MSYFSNANIDVEIEKSACKLSAELKKEIARIESAVTLTDLDRQLLLGALCRRLTLRSREYINSKYF